MGKITTMGCALALGLVWGVVPASAQTTPPKAEQKADQIEKKAEQKADQVEDKAKQDAKQIRKEGDRTADQVRGKTDGKSETVGSKMDRAWDKTKAKAREAKDKVMGADSGVNGDVRSAQMALRDKGHDPGPIDGVMGPRTSAAIRDFQQKENLSVTGQLDAETRSKLTAASSSAAPPSASPSTSAGTPSTPSGAAGPPSASPSTTDKAGNPQGQKQ
jgi:hypothetical protein